MTHSRTIPLALLALAIAVVAGSVRANHPHAGRVAPAPDCAPATVTTCVRQPEKVTHTRVVYRCKTRTICLPYCGGRGCGDCAAGDCGKPRQVRVLIKRFVKEEHCEAKCKPQELPACATPVQACPVRCATPCTKGRPRCLPAPCEIAPGTVIHGTSQPMPAGK